MYAARLYVCMYLTENAADGRQSGRSHGRSTTTTGQLSRVTAAAAAIFHTDDDDVQSVGLPVQVTTKKERKKG